MDLEKARFNVVGRQIRPQGTLDFDVPDALRDIPREKFVGTGFQGLTYANEELPLSNGDRMLEPKVVARLVQGLKLIRQGKVLEIGTDSDYAAALLATLTEKVVTADIDAVQLEAAKTVLNDIGYSNVRYVCSDALAQEIEGTPFDTVYVSGSVGRMSEALKRQLKDGGRVVVIVGGKPIQCTLLITHDGGVFHEKVMFDTLATGLGGKADKPFGDFDF